MKITIQTLKRDAAEFDTVRETENPFPGPQSPNSGILAHAGYLPPTLPKLHPAGLQSQTCLGLLFELTIRGIFNGGMDIRNLTFLCSPILHETRPETQA